MRTRRAKTAVELRDGQSFALAGLLDNSETKSLSQVPVLGEIPILGALFKSKSFQKNETELMFIVTAQLVKPMNRDDLPEMRGIDGLKKGSPLGVEPKGAEIQGRTGFSVTGQNTEPTPVASPKTAEPAKTQEPAVSPKANSGTDTSGGSSTSISSHNRVNPTLPMARVINVEFSPEPFRP